MIYTGYDTDDFPFGSRGGLYKAAVKEPTRDGPIDILSPEQLGMAGWQVGADGRVYERVGGAVMALAPVRTTGVAVLALEGIDSERTPPLTNLRYLFNTLFSQYAREVWVWYAQHRVNKRVFKWFMPIQEGTPGQVTVKDADSIVAAVSSEFKLVGTVHSHPGDGCTPSGVDLSTWARDECSGIHFILGRDGGYTLNACVRGQTWTYDREMLPDVIIPVEIQTQDDLPLDKILLEPTQTYRFSNYGGYHRRDWEDNVTDDPSTYLGRVPKFLINEVEVGKRLKPTLKLAKSDDADDVDDAVESAVLILEPDELLRMEGMADDLERNRLLEMLCDEVEEADGMYCEMEGDSTEFGIIVCDGRIMIGPIEDVLTVEVPKELDANYLSFRIDRVRGQKGDTYELNAS